MVRNLCAFYKIEKEEDHWFNVHSSDKLVMKLMTTLINPCSLIVQGNEISIRRKSSWLFVNFIVSSITMYILWCILCHIFFALHYIFQNSITVNVNIHTYLKIFCYLICSKHLLPLFSFELETFQRSYTFTQKVHFKNMITSTHKCNVCGQTFIQLNVASIACECLQKQNAHRHFVFQNTYLFFFPCDTWWVS